MPHVSGKHRLGMSISIVGYILKIKFIHQVVSLNPTEKKVVLDNGKEITFDKCLIATGKKYHRSR